MLLRMISFFENQTLTEDISLVALVHIKPLTKASRFHNISKTEKDFQGVLIFYNSNKDISNIPQHVLVPPSNRCREFSQRFQQQQKHSKSCEQTKSCRL